METPKVQTLLRLALINFRTEGGIPLQRRAKFRLLYAPRRCRIA